MKADRTFDTGNTVLQTMYQDQLSSQQISIL
jgi:hypothetical protein